MRPSHLILNGSVPLRFKERSIGIDLDFTVFFRVSYTAETVDSKSDFDESLIRDRLIASIQAEYIRKYPDGLSMEEFDKASSSPEWCRDLPDALNDILMFSAGAKIIGLQLEKQWIDPSEREHWDRLIEMSRLRDPAVSASVLIEKANVPIQNPVNLWVCSCGKKNSTNFCPDCGSARSYRQWICSCGCFNESGRFCRECGKPAEPKSFFNLGRQ